MVSIVHDVPVFRTMEIEEVWIAIHIDQQLLQRRNLYFADSLQRCFGLYHLMNEILDNDRSIAKVHILIHFRFVRAMERGQTQVLKFMKDCLGNVFLHFQIDGLVVGQVVHKR